jgi:hypothetical protein
MDSDCQKQAKPIDKLSVTSALFVDGFLLF